MKKTRKILSLVVILALAFSLCVMPVSAYSVIDIDGLTTDDGVFNYYITSGTGGIIDLLIYPYVEGGYYDYDVYDTDFLDWTIITGSISGVNVTTNIPLEIDEGIAWAYTEITVAANAPAGSASLIGEDAYGNTINIVVTVDNATPNAAYVTQIFYDSSSGTDSFLLTTSSGTNDDPVTKNDWHGNTINITTALDAVRYARFNDTNLLDQNITTGVYQPTYYVKSLTFYNYSDPQNPITLTGIDGTYVGWQCRVYRNNVMIPTSEFIGPDEFVIQSYDTIVWKYGDAHTVTFSPTI